MTAATAAVNFDRRQNVQSRIRPGTVCPVDIHKQRVRFGVAEKGPALVEWHFPARVVKVQVAPLAMESPFAILIPKRARSWRFGLSESQRSVVLIAFGS